MREILARLVTILTVVAVVGLSLHFAARHNPPATTPPSSTPGAPRAPTPPPATTEEAKGARDNAPTPSAASEPKTPALITRGRAVYAQQNCATCHAIAGEGNPRAPLDDVGARLNASELKSWITGSGVAAEVLAPAIVRRKQRYLGVAADDLDALIAYLSTLRPAK